MISALLAAMAVCNVPVFLYPQQSLPDVRWPTHAAITLPQGWVRPEHHLYLLEDDQPMRAQVEVVARWPDGSPKWLHAHGSYRYVKGQPAKYTLVRGDKPPDKVPASPLVVNDQPDGITIDTGPIKLVIPRPFAGIARIEAGGQVLVEGAGGPTMIDGNGVVWRAADDKQAEVIVEQQGPARVTVKASGWYRSADGRGEPFCRFVTRIATFADSSIVKIDHATTFADNMKEHDIAELAFPFVLKGASAFSSATHRGAFNEKLRGTFLAQLTDDRVYRIAQHGADPAKDIKVAGDYERSAGWFSAQLGQRRVALLTKDFWQKCPKEVGISPRDLTYYAWPKHGDLAHANPRATALENIYKFECFQRGKLLTSRLPDDYFQALERQKDTEECKPEFAQAANLHGISMRNEFALVVLPNAGDAARANAFLGKLQEVYLQDPIARVSHTAMAHSGVWGPVAAADRDFPEIEKTVNDGMLGYARSIERYNDYGWAIYGNTHHDELMNPRDAGIPQGRPSLHRVWNNNHYQQASTSWRLFAMNGDARMLHWARTITDMYASIGQVRYDKKYANSDPNDPQRRPSIKFHFPGAFFHCKALVPWGGRDYGGDKSDVDAALTGHWPDPSSLLFAWLIDGNRWAKDGYDLWLSEVKLPKGFAAREINTTLVHAITAYDYQPKPEIMEAIQGMRKGLTAMPILAQQPGPIWEPTWMSRYHEMFPKDEAFNQFILKSADELSLNESGIWSLAVSATAYRISGDDKYLRRHFGTLDRVPRRLFRDQQPDKRWEGYGLAPSPTYDGQFLLQWHRFKAALRDAKIDKIVPPDEGGHYLCSAARFDNANDMLVRGLKILMLNPEPATTPLSIQATTISSGDIRATSLAVLSSQAETLLNVPRLPMAAAKPVVVRAQRPSSWMVASESYQVPMSQPGIYMAYVAGEIGLFQPISKLPECQVLKNFKLSRSPDPGEHLFRLTNGYLVPLVSGRIELRFEAMGRTVGSSVSLKDKSGKLLLDQHLRAGQSTSVVLRAMPRGDDHWLLEAFSDHSGYLKMTIHAAADEPMLYGHRLSDVQLIRERIQQ